jgi:hypothetical protein
MMSFQQMAVMMYVVRLLYKITVIPVMLIHQTIVFRIVLANGVVLQRWLITGQIMMVMDLVLEVVFLQMIIS